METITFHSVKGGVDRTSMLTLIAHLLTKKGNKVLLLDFDYTTPALHYKYDNIQSRDGYIEYLRDTPLKTRISKNRRDKQKCIQSLKDKIFQIEENLYLLTAGNDQEVDYWTYISSFSFQKLFYFATKEIAGLSYESFDDQQLTDNKKAFEQDKEYLEKTENFDYLLVDSKSNMETSAVPLLFWSNKIIHFFPYNKGGSTFAINTYTSLINYDSYLDFLPVALVISNTIDQTQIQNDFPDWFPYIYTVSDSNAIQLKEIRESDTQKAPNYWLSSLVNEYIELSAKILAKDTKEISAILNINENNIYKKRIYKQVESKGLLLNTDDQPNISFRIDTFHRIIQSLLKEIVKINDIDTDNNTELLKRTGQNAASGFIDDFMKDHSNIKNKQELIEAWMQFDSDVGFGTIKLESFDPKYLDGTILVIGDAFKTDQQDNQYDLRYIFSGYIETVLKKILQLKNNDLSIEFNNGINENETLYIFNKLEEKNI